MHFVRDRSIVCFADNSHERYAAVALHELYAFQIMQNEAKRGCSTGAAG